jgi:hypothetical protein
MFTRALHWSSSWARWIWSLSSHPISLRSTSILSSQLCLRLPGDLVPYSFPTKTLYALLFVSMHATRPPHVISLTLSKSTSYGASPHVIFSSVLPFHPSLVQIFSSAPCSQIPSVCVPPFMSETKFRSHTNVWCTMIHILNSRVATPSGACNGTPWNCSKYFFIHSVLMIGWSSHILWYFILWCSMYSISDWN